MASISVVSVKAKPFGKNAAPASPAEARKKSLRSVHMGQDCNRIADLPLQPQSGSILQPKVAVAATLGPGGDDFPNPERVVPALRRVKNETHELSIPAQPRCG